MSSSLTVFTQGKVTRADGHTFRIQHISRFCFQPQDSRSKSIVLIIVSFAIMKYMNT